MACFSFFSALNFTRFSFGLGRFIWILRYFLFFPIFLILGFRKATPSSSLVRCFFVVCVGGMVTSFVSWFTLFSNFSFEYSYGEGYLLICYSEFLRNMAMILCSKESPHDEVLTGNSITSESVYATLEEPSQKEEKPANQSFRIE